MGGFGIGPPSQAIYPIAGSSSENQSVSVYLSVSSISQEPPVESLQHDWIYQKASLQLVQPPLS